MITDWTSAQLLELLSEELDARDERIRELKSVIRRLYEEADFKCAQLRAKQFKSEEVEATRIKALGIFEQRAAELKAVLNGDNDG